MRSSLVVVSILSFTFLFALDNTITADVQPQIIEQFGSISKLPWLSVGFFIGGSSVRRNCSREFSFPMLFGSHIDWGPFQINLFWGKMYGEKCPNPFSCSEILKSKGSFDAKWL